MRRIVPLLALLLAASPAAAQNWSAELLRLHNAERARWNVAPMAWDLGLALAADRWAAELARTDRWGHSPRQIRAGQGENLWMGSVNAYPVNAMVGAWLNEGRWFRPGVFPAVSRTGNWSDVGHYSQIVSRRSERVGCAIRSNRRWSYLVCRYSPSGNVDGRYLP
ncbi:hypothetical protein GCM10022280_12150 [Sphingomonas swuensis]|uniref:SCP domain-containing protein n=1 Tax=Sphingomonas swuensis TaxID=977800 RepID=A0ABP7SRB4_9SPHN